ncbi:MAG: DHHA1 domain-containing protein [Pseudomonadota bacterium]
MTKIPSILIIYHAHCPDGFAAALAANLWFEQQGLSKQVDYHAARHGTPIPDCHNKEVYIVDFSYKRETLIKLCQQANKVILIDHHISALKDLENLEQEQSNLQIHFDMQHSGAILTWNYFFNSSAPLLFRYVEDRDIWKFELDDTNDVMSAVVSYPMEFKLWKSWLTDENSLDKLKLEGKVLNRERNKLIRKYKKRARVGEIAGFNIPIVNAPSSIASDLLQELSANQPFAASYEDREDRRIWQLRSSGEQGLDVSEIATQYGGGGHKRASGFSVELQEIKL